MKDLVDKKLLLSIYALRTTIKRRQNLQLITRLQQIKQIPHMNTLTIPQLSLFPHRKTSHHLPDHNYLRYDHTLHSRNTYTTKLSSSPTTRDYPPTTRGISSNSRYKQIAEDYLDKRTKSPSYYIDSTPYIHNVPNFLPRQAKEFGGCKECDSPHNVRKENEKRSEYFWLDKNRQHETKLLKDPYLQPTFRQGKGFVNSVVPSQRQWGQSQRNASNNLKNVSKLEFKPQAAQSLRQQSYVSKRQREQIVTNSKIMQKLKTHQSDQVQESIRIDPKKQLHQASIQTVNVSNHSMNVQTQRTRRQTQRPNVQKILQEQKMLIESLKFEVERQGDFKHEVEDLQTTKNDYIEKSREILLKLNELADDKRDFGFVVKALASTKKTNPFRDLDF